jgi:predicted DNA binding CopG/RHH family protein
MSDEPRLKPFPSHATDEDAERFVDEADLSEFDFSAFEPTSITFSDAVHVDLLLSAALLEAVEKRAKERGISSMRLIQDALERAVAVA